MVIFVLPFCMFRSQNPHAAHPLQVSLPNLCALGVEIPAPPARNTQQIRPPLSPFPAILTDHSQPIENAITLSPVFATLTDNVKHKSFVCHSYKKHPGGGYLNFTACCFGAYHLSLLSSSSLL